LWDCPAACVVAAQDEDRVVIEARFFDGIQHLTDAIVHLSDDVGKQSAALGSPLYEVESSIWGSLRIAGGATLSSPVV
jgi:hypothetical protein